MRVLLDCDGVLADFIGGVCAAVFYETGRHVAPEQVTRFDFVKELNLDEQSARAVKRHISDEQGFWRYLNVYPGAVAGVKALQSVAEVYIVTSPWNSCPTWLHDREWWLREHFDIPHSHVIACSAKHLVAGDMLVDDKTSTLLEWEDEQSMTWQLPDGSTGRTFAVQWETPHNRFDGWLGRSTNSWAQLVEWAQPTRRFDLSDIGVPDLREP